MLFVLHINSCEAATCDPQSVFHGSFFYKIVKHPIFSLADMLNFQELWFLF